MYEPTQRDPNLPPPPEAVLPTMYDLPSEQPEEPGVPDEFHVFQPQLLRETCQPVTYPADQVFVGTDINLYYDSRQPQWYKRPDWFVVLGVPRAQTQQTLRLSYVIWMEGVVPFLVVELLSPGTEAEDLGQTLREVNQPPTKWQAYEQILRVPYYLVFDRYQNHLRVFQLVGTRYQEMVLSDQRIWFAEMGLGIGVWQGTYANAEGLWLRWYNAANKWLPTAEELATQAEQRATRAEQQAAQERQRSDRLAARLRALGIDPDQV